MNKATKHIQSASNGPKICNNILAPSSSPLAPLKSSFLEDNSSILDGPHQLNVISSIMNFLPDNRPITSLQIVEDHEKCPKNFTAISRTYDQDADADLWRETNILFGRQTTRYLCLSKTEGLPEYVVETLKVIAEKIPPPKEFSLLSRTADSEQKAWRKRQIAYKLSKRSSVTHAVTDIILCSKLKIAPNGFKLAGDINGVLVCYKTCAIPARLPPPVPGGNKSQVASPQPNSLTTNDSSNCNESSEIEKALNRLSLNEKSQNNSGPPKYPLPPIPSDADHDYEEIASSYRIKSPVRPAPPLPNAATKDPPIYVGTLSSYTELEGVPFIINPSLRNFNNIEDTSSLPNLSITLTECDYDFNLERQVLCTMKASSSKNPFFN